MKLFASAGALCLAGLAGAAPAVAHLIPAPGQPVAVLHRDVDGPAALETAAAEGAVLLSRRGTHVTFVLSDDPDFARRMQAAGPWIVLDAALLGGCQPHPPSPGLHLAGGPAPGTRLSEISP